MMLKPHEPRSITIIRHVNDFLLGTSTTAETFADDVKEHYHAMVPNIRARVMNFHEGGDVVADMRANGQLVKRIIDRAVKFPADLEEAMLHALPKERKARLLSDLVERYGLLPVAIPDADNVNGDVAAISKLLIETGQAVEALAPIIADGVVNIDDEPHAARAIKEIDDALAELLSWRVRLSSFNAVSR